jgi:hypothetical protein
MEKYGKKTRYKPGKILEFPDFTLEYSGTSTVPWPNHATFKFTFHNFVVRCDGAVETVSWSSGTGEI